MKRSRVLVPKGLGQIAPGFNLGGTEVQSLRRKSRRDDGDDPERSSNMLGLKYIPVVSSPSSLRDSGFFGVPCPQAEAWGYLPKSPSGRYIGK